jgi:hypothetical protein
VPDRRWPSTSPLVREVCHRLPHMLGYAEATTTLTLLRSDTRFLEKPFTPEALLAATADALDA